MTDRKERPVEMSGRENDISTDQPQRRPHGGCPECGAALVKDGDDFRCPNVGECPNARPLRSAIKRSELGTWYPPGERNVVQALRLAVKHGSPEKAILALDRQIHAWNAINGDARTLYLLQRTRVILQFWHVAEEEATLPRG